MLACRWFCLFLVLNAWAFAQEKPAVPEQTSRPLESQLPRQLPGMQTNGRVQLPTQWSLQPVGKQIPLGDLPVNIALHPTEKWCAILHAGYGEHEVVIVDLQKDSIFSRVSIPQSFYGIVFDATGERLFVSGGEHEVIHRFVFKAGFLGEHVQIPIVPSKEEFVPTGLALSGDGKTLFVAGGWGDRIAILPSDAGADAKPRFIDLLTDDYPYGVLPSRDGKRLFVSLWGHAAVQEIEVASGKILRTWKTAEHPTELLLHPERELLYVACANSNSVAVIDLEANKVLEQITSSLFPTAPVGSTPNSLSLSKSGKVLVIANADNNNLALFDITKPGFAKSLGFIPVGWYPTSVRFQGANDRILVANGKGMSSKANSQGPRPGAELPANVREYIGGLFKGTLSLIAPPTPEDLAKYTTTAYACSPLNADASPRVQTRTAGNPIPAKVGEASPISHCLYIIKENRTYDQVFGDLPQGNGDPSLCLFPERVTPNHHALAQQFVLLDNFYVESEVSADGHEWSMAAYATVVPRWQGEIEVSCGRFVTDRGFQRRVFVGSLLCSQSFVSQLRRVRSESKKGG
jgi:DNA-binding beta-propeller fold protein YncE